MGTVGTRAFRLHLLVENIKGKNHKSGWGAKVTDGAMQEGPSDRAGINQEKRNEAAREYGTTHTGDRERREGNIQESLREK